MVVFHHYMQVYRDFKPENQIELFFAKYGNIGVDIFFVLSGFIMAFSISSRKIKASRFFYARLTRILPAYWIATLIFILTISQTSWGATHILNNFGWKEFFYSLAFAPHEHLSGIGLHPVLTVGWTLNYEIFFYVILTLSIIFFKDKAIIFSIAIITTLPIFSNSIYNLGSIPSSHLIWEFSLGIILYLIQEYLKSLQFIKKSSKYISALIFIASSLVLINFQFFGHRMLASFLLVFGFILLEEYFQRNQSKIGKFCVHLGDLSYSTYLYHLVAIFAVGNIIDTSRDNDFLLLSSVALITYLLSLVSYFLIEKKLRETLMKPLTS